MAKKPIELKKLTTDASKVNKTIIPGFEAVVVEMRKLTKEIDAKEEQKSNLRQLIMNKVSDQFKTNMTEGEVIKSYLISSADKVPATVLYKNAFSKLDVSNEGPMREVLKEHFDTLFSKDKTVTMKPGADLAKIKEMLGDEFDKFFATTEMITFKKEWMEKMMEVRPNLTKGQVAQLDLWQRQCQNQPDFRLGEGPEATPTNGK